ncbi:MAG: hypothetical protein FWG63_01605 [Defluviitaleaceae bacterium]|nr:hypothetical protein [Defluviitaleaceae bacterium]
MTKQQAKKITYKAVNKNNFTFAEKEQYFYFNDYRNNTMNLQTMKVENWKSQNHILWR